jgi:superfamily II DNA or RNA helicase
MSTKKAKKSSARKPKILVREKVYIPKDQLDYEAVKKSYVTDLFEDRICAHCEYRHERYSSACDGCPGFKERIVLFNSKVFKGTTYIGLPLGDKHNIEKRARIDYDDFTVVDRRTLAPFDYKIKFIATLRPQQVQLAEDFLKKKHGLVIAPPRTGKTITSLFISLELGQKTIVMANQHEYLSQFMDHIHGNEKEGIPKCTNLPELEQKAGKKLYGFPKTDADFENFQFIFVTYQALISKFGPERLKKLNTNFGTLFVDEVHKSSATAFATTVSKVRSRFKFGCTGTLDRKDKKEFIAKAMLGPPAAIAQIDALTPTVYVYKTEVEGRTFRPGPAAWTYAMQYLMGHDKRNKQIVDMAIKDLKRGHNLLIPTLYVNHAKLLVKMINEQWGSEIADTFLGNKAKKDSDARSKHLALVKANKMRVTVGTRSIVGTGLNVPSWSCIYEISPINNEPNLKQETSRICTPQEGKRPPVIRLFVDLNQPQSAGCARATLKHFIKFKFAFSSKPKQKETVHAIFNYGRKTDYNPSDEFTPYSNENGKRSVGLALNSSPIKRL